MSLDVDRGGKNEPAKFTIVGLRGKYIFKPQSARYPFLPDRMKSDYVNLLSDRIGRL